MNINLETWTKLIGKSQDDPAVKKALAAAGVKKKPKLNTDRTFVQFDLEGQGLALRMTDKAYLKELKNQRIGQGPLIFSGISAYLDKSLKNVYTGVLPYKIKADMSREEVRKILGRPKRTGRDFPFDVWSKAGLEVIVNYSEELNITSFALMLPHAE